jgi:hypothetical protein
MAAASGATLPRPTGTVHVDVGKRMGTTRARRGTSAVVLLATLLAATSCGSASPSSTGAAGDALHAPHAAPLSPPQAPPAAQAGTTSAVELRSTLERLLGAHVLYADELARARLSGRQELIAAASASVERNQQQLIDAVTALAGASAGQEFSAAWQNHVTVLGDYVTAQMATARRTPARRGRRHSRRADVTRRGPAPQQRCRAWGGAGAVVLTRRRRRASRAAPAAPAAPRRWRAGAIVQVVLVGEDHQGGLASCSRR